MRQFVVFSGLCLVLLTPFSCGPAQDDALQPLDLTQYDIPLTILAPDSATVKNSNLSGIIQDVTVTGEDDYNIQILASRASTNDMARLKAEQLELVRDNRYFSSIVEENPDGFIFENKIDTAAVYGFRHIVYQGDREFIFQNAFGSTHDLATTQRLYAAVRQ